MAKDIKEITEKLEQGVKAVYESNSYKEYLDFMSKFHDYSVNNIILILTQMPEATYVAGFQAWKKKFNRQVRKGEKGITILAPCQHKYVKLVEAEDGTKEEREIRYTTFHTTTVFDISQTDGDKVPSYVKALEGSVENYTELIGKLEAVAPVPVSFEEIATVANGFFQTAEKRIVIKAGMSEAQTVKTMIHEISHAILHDLEDGTEKGAGRSLKEVQAESVAYTVCQALGLDSSEYSFGYIAGWSEGRDAKELTASMEVIRKTSNDLLEKIKAA